VNQDSHPHRQPIAQFPLCPLGTLWPGAVALETLPWVTPRVGLTAVASLVRQCKRTRECGRACSHSLVRRRVAPRSCDAFLERRQGNSSQQVRTEEREAIETALMT